MAREVFCGVVYMYVSGASLRMPVWVAASLLEEARQRRFKPAR